MNKALIAIVIIAIIIAGGYFLLGNSYKQAPATSDAVSETSSGQVSETAGDEISGTASDKMSDSVSNDIMEKYVIVYTDKGFSPDSITIQAGEIVTWKNGSSRAMWPASAKHPTHVVYSGTSLNDHCPDPDNTAFDACGGIQPGDSWSFTFEKTGTWFYHDHLTPSFFGSVEVK